MQNQSIIESEDNQWLGTLEAAKIWGITQTSMATLLLKYQSDLGMESTTIRSRGRGGIKRLITKNGLIILRKIVDINKSIFRSELKELKKENIEVSSNSVS